MLYTLNLNSTDTALIDNTGFKGASIGGCWWFLGYQQLLAGQVSHSRTNLGADRKTKQNKAKTNKPTALEETKGTKRRIFNINSKVK